MGAPDESWSALPSPVRQAMELAWESCRRGSFGIGAVVTTDDGQVVTTGRNRILERDPGDDVLAGTSVAHAEMNALAKLGYGHHVDQPLTLWTTLQPCIQCLGAIRLSAVTEVYVLAPDPLFRGVERARDLTPFLAQRWPTYVHHDVDHWSVLSVLFPTHLSAFWGVAIDGWATSLPAVSGLAAELAAATTLVELAAADAEVTDVAAALWERLGDCVPELRVLAGNDG